jgi:hypothetical protein
MTEMMKPRTETGQPASEPRNKRGKRFATVSPYGRVSSTRYNNQKRGMRIVDGNSCEANFLRRCQKSLIEHLGGEPTVPQRALISRIAWCELRLTLLDKKMIESNETDYDNKTYNAHVNSVRRLYSQLGIGKPKASFAKLLQSKP